MPFRLYKKHKGSLLNLLCRMNPFFAGECIFNSKPKKCANGFFFLCRLNGTKNNTTTFSGRGDRTLAQNLQMHCVSMKKCFLYANCSRITWHN